MKSTTLTPHITQLTRFGLVNAYLVREDDGLTLVDTMVGGSAQGILAAAQELGAPIRRIALTHGHADHVGSVDALREALGADVPVLLTARDARILAGDKSLDPDERDGKLRGGWPSLKTATRPIAAGERVGSLEVVAAPGHTPGHVAFLDVRDRSMICGDAYTTVGAVATSARFHARFPFAAMATWSAARERATARALRDLEPSILAPGHGRAVPQPSAAMDAALARVGA